MKLRTFLLTGAVSVIGVMLCTFSYFTSDIFEEAAQKVSKTQDEQLAKVVQSAILTKIEALKGFNRVIRTDNDLASAYILSKEAKDPAPVSQRLETIRTKSGFDIVTIEEVTPEEVKAEVTPKVVKADATPLLKSPASQESVLLGQFNNKPALTLRSPIELYGSQVGVLVLGYYLQGSLSDDLSHLINGSVVLGEANTKSVLVAGANQSVLTLGARPGSASALTVQITPAERIAPKIKTEYLVKILTSGFISLACLGLLLFLGLEFGFTSRFRKLSVQAQSIAKQIDSGTVPSNTIAGSRIFENNLIAQVLNQLIVAFQRYLAVIEEKSKLKAQTEKQEALNEMARLVSHNIRSPLISLEKRIETASELSESSRRLIMSTVGEIRNQVHALEASAKGTFENRTAVTQKPTTSVAAGVSRPSGRTEVAPHSFEAHSNQLLVTLIEEVIAAKRFEYLSKENVTIQFDGADQIDLFAVVQPNEFKVVLSNLINNAIEASTSGSLLVKVTLSKSDAGIQVQVSDDGCGISSEILAKLGASGFTYGKSGGQGVGLFHAKSCAKHWKGSLDITSQSGKGTQVLIQLPKASIPQWYQSKIVADGSTEFIVVDDDSSIHELWQIKASEARITNQFHFFLSPDECNEWLRSTSKPIERLKFLVDHEFNGSSQNGIDFIESLNRPNQCVLVTGRFNEASIQSRAEWLDVRILPKAVIHQIRIRFRPKESDNALDLR